MWHNDDKGIIENIKEEHINRTKWMDENLSIRERARMDRQCALSILKAFIVYFTILGIMWVVL